MDWLIPISDKERDAGRLLPATATAVLHALRQHGCALLRGVFTRDFVDALHTQYSAQYGGLDSDKMTALASSPGPNPILMVGDNRYEVVPRMTGVFADPALLANPLLLGFLPFLLGPDLRLSVFTIVTSFPGAHTQHVHRDHGPLFFETGLGALLPAFAINVAIPLIDVDLETGPTGVWPGSHVLADTAMPAPETACSLPYQRGDCVLHDYRTIHAGLPNRGKRVRPILYMAYARTWFFDEVNHRDRTPLNMSFETLQSLPPAIQPLLNRIHSQAMRTAQIVTPK